MELQDAEDAMGIRKILAHDIRMKKNPKRIQKPRRTLSGFLRIFMELCRSEVPLAHPQGNFISGVANAETVYMLLRFQVPCIDWFFFFFKTLTFTENLLKFNRTYAGRKQPFESFFEKCMR